MKQTKEQKVCKRCGCSLGIIQGICGYCVRHGRTKEHMPCWYGDVKVEEYKKHVLEIIDKCPDEDILMKEDVKQSIQEFLEELKESLINDDISIYDYRKEMHTNAELQKAVKEQIDRFMKDIDTFAKQKFGEKILN